MGVEQPERGEEARDESLSRELSEALERLMRCCVCKEHSLWRCVSLSCGHSLCVDCLRGVTADYRHATARYTEGRPWRRAVWRPAQQACPDDETKPPLTCPMCRATLHPGQGWSTGLPLYLRGALSRLAESILAESKDEDEESGAAPPSSCRWVTLSYDYRVDEHPAPPAPHPELMVSYSAAEAPKGRRSAPHPRRLLPGQLVSLPPRPALPQPQYALHLPAGDQPAPVGMTPMVMPFWPQPRSLQPTYGGWTRPSVGPVQLPPQFHLWPPGPVVTVPPASLGPPATFVVPQLGTPRCCPLPVYVVDCVYPDNSCYRSVFLPL